MLALRRMRLPPPSGGDHEPIWLAKEQSLLAAAAHARREAETRKEVYRDFYVGVSALVRHDFKGREFFSIHWGYNRKLQSGYCPHRRCGEMHAMEKALAAGAHEVVGFVIDGPPQPDDLSGQELDALMPCGHCRNEFRSLIEINMLITPETRILSKSSTGVEPVRSTVSSWLAQCGGSDDPAIEQLAKHNTYINAGRSG